MVQLATGMQVTMHSLPCCVYLVQVCLPAVTTRWPACTQVTAVASCRREEGLEVMYTVIQSLTADGRDRGLDYKLSGFHVPPGSPDAQVGLVAMAAMSREPLACDRPLPTADCIPGPCQTTVMCNPGHAHCPHTADVAVHRPWPR